MNLTTLIILWIEEELKKNGYRWQLWTPLGKLRARVLIRNRKSVVLIDGIPIPPPSKCNINEEIEGYFQRLKKTLDGLQNKHSITDLFFRGGGTNPVPDWFRDWCSKNGIVIHVVGDDGENLPEMVGGEPGPWLPLKPGPDSQALIDKYSKKRKEA